MAGCTTRFATSSGSAGFVPTARAPRPPRLLKIQHIVVVIQENRSFDNLFATFPGADGTRYGRMHDGTRIALRESSLSIRKDICHEYLCWEIEYDNARMDGFDEAYFAMSNSPPLRSYAYR